MNAVPVSAENEPLLDAARLQRADTVVRQQPFAFLIAQDQLPDAARGDLARDFPRYPSAGFFPHEVNDCGPSVNRLIGDLTSREFADAIGRHLGIPDLGRYPSLVTLCRLLNKRHGTIHTDSRSKVATALLYLEPEWPNGSAGALRFLSRIDSIDAMVAPEVAPVYGTIAAFKRADDSFHGHLPFEGERKVIQVAWLTSLEEMERKTRRGRFSRLLKKIAGRLDAWWGSGRGRDASHPTRTEK